MELYFLVLLLAIMIAALTSGYPVAFALPGSAILTIAIAALCGYLFVGDVDAYFVLGGPNQWLSAGVTNFRSLYWNVERDTLIAIPLFIFMGIMLQRSRIAEDLLVAMAQLFGPVPGGLGISVVFVGALLAATTGIVGATVIAMGLISLPAMLRNNYDKSLACGTICASGTLGQIIPPSIVLIILADQLSNAADQAATTRKADFRESTGEFAMPSDFDVVSASAGDMFMGAFIPGLILVGLYMLYILVSALIKPKLAPPVPFEGEYNSAFVFRVVLALFPPLTLIFIVLGSIVLGVATVNQAGAIGAVGALIMGSYRLMEGKKRAYYPAILAIGSIICISILQASYDLNIKNITNEEDAFGVMLALISVAVLVVSIVWSILRAFRIDDTLTGVMIETAKTTSMVFIILIGAAMLTSAFRAFGGEELVKEYLTGLPGGFWTQFIVVMAVIFFLGFFLDFIEIAVVVVPIVAPILLAEPSANVTAVWLGVMIGLNIQTSFLTPPFGFALFYLRGVAPKIVKTTHIYKGAAAFIVLQLVGLAIAGIYPPLVNYLPNKTHLTSETAPPPNNPKLQLCLETDLFEFYQAQQPAILSAITNAKQLNTGYFPEAHQTALLESFDGAESVFEQVSLVQQAEQAVLDYSPEYRPIHTEVRLIKRQTKRIDREIKRTEQQFQRIRFEENVTDEQLNKVEHKIEELKTEKLHFTKQLPEGWEHQRDQYRKLAKAEKKARSQYRRLVDDSYQVVVDMRKTINDVDHLILLKPELESMFDLVRDEAPDVVMPKLKALGVSFDEIKNGYMIKSGVSKARRALRGKNPDRDKAIGQLQKAMQKFEIEVKWRKRAKQQFLAGLTEYNAVISSSIGARMQERLSLEQAKNIASCLAVHRDISLNF